MTALSWQPERLDKLPQKRSSPRSRDGGLERIVKGGGRKVRVTRFDAHELTLYPRRLPCAGVFVIRPQVIRSNFPNR